LYYICWMVFNKIILVRYTIKIKKG